MYMNQNKRSEQRGILNLIGISVITVLLLLLIGGCSFTIKPDPHPRISGPANKYPLKVGLYIQDEQLNQKFSKCGFCLVGVAHTWKVPVGQGLRTASERSLRQIFTEVNRLNYLDEGKDNSLNIVFTPSIRNFEISQSIATGFFLKAIIYDINGEIIYQNEVQGKTTTSGPGTSACIGGVFAAQNSFTESVNSAFEDAFQKLFQDMLIRVDFAAMADS